MNATTENATTETTTPAAETVYRCEEQWGDASFPSLAELDAAIREVCRINPGDFEYPEDGLREGRDYTIETTD